MNRDVQHLTDFAATLDWPAEFSYRASWLTRGGVPKFEVERADHFGFWWAHDGLEADRDYQDAIREICAQAWKYAAIARGESRS